MTATGTVPLVQKMLATGKFKTEAQLIAETIPPPEVGGEQPAFGRYLDSECDLLVNAAGEGFAPKPLDELGEADWDAAFGATAKGSFFVTQAAAPALPVS